MSCTRTQILAQARAWLGCKESDGSHKKIIDVYNSHTPRARGYKLKYTDAWCSGFVSACAIACGATDIIPTEVGVGKHIDLFRKLGIWEERDDYVPTPGDIIVYYWKDSGSGDCKSGASHIGFVEAVDGGMLTVIEGNYSDSVKRRSIAINGRYIRGFAVPEYAQEGPITVTLPRLCRGCQGQAVKPLQGLLYALGYPLGASPMDGSYGPKTQQAVLAYQRKKGLTPTAVADAATWQALLEAGQ